MCYLYHFVVLPSNNVSQMLVSDKVDKSTLDINDLFDVNTVYFILDSVTHLFLSSSGPAGAPGLGGAA